MDVDQHHTKILGFANNFNVLGDFQKDTMRPLGHTAGRIGLQMNVDKIKLMELIKPRNCIVRITVRNRNTILRQSPRVLLVLPRTKNFWSRQIRVRIVKVKRVIVTTSQSRKAIKSSKLILKR